MKPVNLKISGLHSYREPQEIDFAQFGDAGVFGIFGPTGSGKSTILDAITLALYGKVERALHNTQGIMNHAVDSLTVSFTFQLGGKNLDRRYRVERRYARTGGNSVRNTYSRLVEVAPPTEAVVADKEREVTQGIEALLGLKVEDFTRAVVLPQGRFAEFLNLKGLERRQMLQRLFNLEVYGNRLNERIKMRKDEAEKKLTSVTGEQRGMGDASAEALAQAKDRLSRATGQKNTVALAQQQALSLYNETKQVWEWQEELARLAGEEEVLVRRQAENEAIEADLDMASRAETVRPRLEELTIAQELYRQARMGLNTAEAGKVKAEKIADTAQQAFEAAHQARLREEPELTARKTRLVEAAGLEAQLAGKNQELACLIDELAAGREAVASLKERLLAKLDEKFIKEQQIREANQRLSTVHVQPDYRQEIMEAAAILQDCRTAERALEAAMNQHSEKEKALGYAAANFESEQAKFQEIQAQAAAVQSGLEQLLGDCPEEAQALEAGAQTLERWRHGVSEAVRRLQEIEAEQLNVAIFTKELELASQKAAYAGAKLADARKAAVNAKEELAASEASLQEKHDQNTASGLAASLRHGEPCPVCGSREHPSPLPAAADEAVQAAERLAVQSRQKLIECENHLAQVLEADAAGRAGVAAGTETVSRVKESLRQKEDLLRQVISNLPEDWRSVTAGELHVAFQREEAAFAHRQENLRQWQSLVDGAKSEVEKHQKALADANVRIAAATASLEAARTALTEARAMLDTAAAELEQKHGKLEAARGNLAAEQIDEQVRQFVDWDREASILREEKERNEAMLNGLVQALEQINSEKSSLEIQLAKAAARQDALAREAAGMKAQVQAVAGDLPAGQVLQETQLRLTQVRQDEENASSFLEQARQEKGQWDQSYAAARSEWEVAGKRLNYAKYGLNRVLQETDMPNVEAVTSALRVPEDLASLKQAVEEYRAAKQRISNEQRRLTGLLAGRSTTAEEWEACQRRSREADEIHQQAIAQYGAALQDHAGIAARNSRWLELEQGREQLNEEFSRLAELQNIFRGNAFVEYMAEEQMASVAQDASARLGRLTNYRYALEVDSEGGFIIRDDMNGGVRRPVSSLSGGETFLTSLALALALSSQIQLRGEVPLEFFFLDEGFGSLDLDCLEIAMNTLEQLRLERMTIGVISHVPEMRMRLPRRLVVIPSGEGSGSQIHLETD